MNTFCEIRRNTYYDSVALMIVSKELKKTPEVSEVLVGMGTPLNKELAYNLNLSCEDLSTISANDFFIALSSSEESVMTKIIPKLDELLNSRRKENSDHYCATTLSSAIKHSPQSNIALISIPGQYATTEAEKALNSGLHVMLFSDNVSIEDEIRLKKLGKEKGLLVMGPDCGTAIINHVPLCFANAVRRGTIGIVGASGTGTQEVSVLIDSFGGGVTQVIGTGGRDLTSAVGGIMMIEGFKALIEDVDTKVIVLISKPPAPEVAKKILHLVKTTTKPVVVNFIGGDRSQIEKSGAYACISLEDTALKAIALSNGQRTDDFAGFSRNDDEIDLLINNEVSKLKPTQKYFRGLYTGGTLADETMKILQNDGFKVYSNIPLSPELKLESPSKSKGHTCIDLGDDLFTRGRPHPMIDPIGRIERLPLEAQDLDVAVILMDFVLGYGSHQDPVGEMLPHIIAAKEHMENLGQHLIVVGYICGTKNDPQGYVLQKEKLENAGVIVMPSNAQAVRFVSKIITKINKYTLEKSEDKELPVQTVQGYDKQALTP